MATRPKYFNSGSQFENEHATKDTHPDMKGLLDVEGDLFWISSWWKKTKDGADFLSHSLERVTDEQMEKYFKGQNPPEGYLSDRKKDDKPAQGKSRGRRSNDGDHRNPTEADRPAQPAKSRNNDFMDDMDDDLPF